MKTCNVIDLGLINYRQALSFQRELFRKRHADQIKDTLVLCEHFPVYTCGRSADSDSLIIGKLDPKAELIRVDRGGSITFHGPGQLMMYPIITLPRHPEQQFCHSERSAVPAGRQEESEILRPSASRMTTSSSSQAPQNDSSVMAYIRSLEQVIIRSLAVYGIKAGRGEVSGVWVADKKIASAGIKISSRITMHGLALNVNCDLAYFKPILACGLNTPVTSMRKLLGYEIEVSDISDLIILNFGKILNYRMSLFERKEYEFTRKQPKNYS